MLPMKVRVYTSKDITYGHLFLDEEKKSIYVKFESPQYKCRYLSDTFIRAIDVMYPSLENL